MDLGRRIIRQRRSLRNFLYRLLDAAAIVSGLSMAVAIVPQNNSDATLISCLAGIGLFSIACEFTAMYRDWQGVSIHRELTCATATWTLTLGCLVVFGRFSAYTTELAGSSLAIWFIATPLISIAGRALFREGHKLLIDRGMVGTGYAIVGVNSLGIQLFHNI